jgi:isocitrate dehydrogenase
MTASYTNQPQSGSKIRIQGANLVVPDDPIIPFVEGDGIGSDIWRASHRIFESAIRKAYGNRRKVNWLEVYAGQKAFDQTGEWLPNATLDAFKEYLVGIKGPLTTPVGGGIRSLNVALRKGLDLFVCQRPVRWFEGVPSPVRRPDLVDMVVFRENTEDIYTGIEFAAGTPENQSFKDLLEKHFPGEFAKIRFPDSSGFSLKPVSEEGTHRLVRAAIRWALENQRRSVTLVHKGNIMKFTEGAFRNWGYELAEREFGEKVYTSLQWQRTKKEQGEDAANHEQQAALANGRLLIKDLIADIVFERVLTRPAELDVLATMNLNGDYLSDALAAQVGGVGIAPGGNINYNTGVALFEATHGTAPDIAGKNIANPCSFLLSGEMMFRYLGWTEAADLIVHAIECAIQAHKVTFDLHHLMDQGELLSTAEFADVVIEYMEKE